MDDDPLQSVYSYVERAYVRLQAGDFLEEGFRNSQVDDPGRHPSIIQP